MTHPFQNNLLENMSLLDAMRCGGAVRRYHTHTHIIGQQTVAEHTFNMLCMLFWFVPIESGLDLTKLGDAILLHDVAEGAVGDTPSPAKRANAALRTALDEAESAVLTRLGIRIDLSPVEQWWLNTLDWLEGAMFARDQLVLGNVSMKVVFGKFMGILLTQREAAYWTLSLEMECQKLVSQYQYLTRDTIKWP